MHRKKLLLSLLMIVSVVFFGCQAAQDSKLTAKVKTKITEDKQLDHSDISVDTKNGVVTLTGKVENSSQVDEAVQIAKSVEGVKDVTQSLTVEGNTATLDSNPVDHAAHEVGQTFDDASTTAKVKLALGKEKDVDAIHIDVDTKDGVVSLKGVVKSDSEARRAVEVARSVEGVKDVNSDLKVGS